MEAHQAAHLISAFPLGMRLVEKTQRPVAAMAPNVVVVVVVGQTGQLAEEPGLA